MDNRYKWIWMDKRVTTLARFLSFLEVCLNVNYSTVISPQARDRQPFMRKRSDLLKKVLCGPD